MIAWLAGCAALRPVGGDDVFSVTARTRGDEATLRVEVIEGWHLNREYPSGFEADAGQTTELVIDGGREGHVVVPASTGGTLHLGFCEAERCRIEHVRFEP